MTVAFFVHCGTGCSCCNDENHYTGPYRSLKYAKDMVATYTKDRRLASQYARNGRYEICWSDSEILQDGRIICSDRVFSGFSDDEEVFNDDISDSDFYPDCYDLKQLPEGYGV